MRWFRVARIVGLAIALGSSAGAWAADFAVGYVQSARLLRESPQIKHLKSQVAKEFAAREGRLKQMHRHIEAQQRRLTQEGGFLDSGQQRHLRERIGAERRKYRRALDELAQDKHLRYAEQEEKVARVIREVVEQVAQDERLDMVLQSGALWVSPRVDITDKVLARLRQMAETQP